MTVCRSSTHYEEVSRRRKKTKRDRLSTSRFHRNSTSSPRISTWNASCTGGRRSGSGTSGTFSTSQSESSFGESTITTSLPTSSRKYLPPEVIEEKKRSRRRRTAAYICLGVLAIALVALAVGVILHFLLETGSIGGGGRVPSPKEQ